MAGRRSGSRHDDVAKSDSALSRRSAAAGSERREYGASRAWSLTELQRKAGNAAVCGAVARLATTTLSAPLVQRFDSPEHVAIGDQATLGPVKESTGLRYTEDLKDELSFGEVVAMAGDFFGSIEEMRKLSANAEGRQQLAYARAKVTNSPLPAVGEAAMKAVDDRYFRLASRNRSHFAGGGDAQISYEKGHMQALASAWISGHEKRPADFSEALQEEAFCLHYLTDMFSAGHIRTPRASIQDWYVEHFGTSVVAMKKWLSDYLVRRLNALNPEQLKYVPDLKIAGTVDDMLNDMAGSALDSFSLGDLVSLAMHNFDNKRGVPVISKCDTDGKPGDFHWTAFGDKEIGSGGGAGDRATTFTMAAAAARASREELDSAYRLGSDVSATHVEVYQLEGRAIAAVNALAPSKALPYIPREDTENARPGNAGDMSDGPLGDWRWGKFSPEMRGAFEAAVLADVVGKITEASVKVPEPKDVGWPVGKIHARQAVVDLAGQIGRAPLTTFEALFGPAS